MDIMPRLLNDALAFYRTSVSNYPLVNTFLVIDAVMLVLFPVILYSKLEQKKFLKRILYSLAGAYACALVYQMFGPQVFLRRAAEWWVLSECVVLAVERQFNARGL